MAYKNKIIALVIALSLIVGAVPAFALASGSAMDEGVYSSAFGALRAFGIVDSDADDEVNTELITRYEFVKLVVGMYESAGVSFEGGANVFSDAQDGTKCAEVLAKAASAGIIHGDGSSAFRISDIITEDEALTIALNVLGYNSVKDSYKSYYDYLSVAQKLELTDNVYAGGGQMNYSDAYMLLYNTLNANTLEVGTISQKNGNVSISYNRRDSKTLIEALFGIKRAEGVLIADDEMNIVENDRLKENHYKLSTDDGNMILKAEDGDFHSLIGMNVYAYYKEGGVDMLVYMEEISGENDCTDIKGEDIISYNYSTRKLEYYKRTEISELKSDLKEKDVKIPLDVNVVYNSYYVPDNKIVFDKINSAVNSEGETNIKNIKLLDNNGDGKPDIMFVNMYTNFLVERFTKDGVAMDYYTKDILDFKNEKNIVVRNENGSIIKYTDIAAYNVLSIFKDLDGENLTTVYVSTKKTQGVLQQKNDRNGYFLTINDVRSELANGKYTEALYDKVSEGDSYTIYFDISGKIAGFNVLENSMNYGYILNSGVENGLSGKKVLKIVVPDDSDNGYTISVYSVKDSFELDGQSKSSAKNYNFDTLKFKLIRFSANSKNEITVIDTPATTRGRGEFSYVNYKEASGPVTTAYRSNWAMMIEDGSSVDDKAPANFATSDDTIILAVPKDETVDNPEKNVARIESLADYAKDWGIYDVNGFVLDENDLACRVLLFYMTNDDGTAAQTLFERQRVFVVDSISKATNNEGKTTILLKGMERRRRAAYTTTDNEIIDGDTKQPITVHEGDILQVRLNVFGDIKYVRRLYDFENDSYGKIKYSFNPRSSPRVVVGTPFSTDAYRFTMTEKTKPETWEYTEVFCCSGDHYVYVYDAKDKEVTLGSYRDITAEPGARVVVWTETATFMDVVVYKNRK